MWSLSNSVSVALGPQPTRTTLIATDRCLNEPAAKRPCIEDTIHTHGDAFKRSLRARVIPAIYSEAKKLPGSHDKTGIAQRVLRDIITTSDVLKHFNQHLCLQPDFELEVARRGIECVKKAAQQYAAPTSIQPAPANDETKALTKLRPPIAAKKENPSPKPAHFLDRKRPLRPVLSRRQRRASIDSDRIVLQTLKHRPYRTKSELDLIAQGIHRLKWGPKDLPEQPIIYHVDFSQAEINQLLSLVRSCLPDGESPTLQVLCGTDLLHNVIAVSGRSKQDVKNFCSDVVNGCATLHSARVLSLQPETPDLCKERQVSLRSGRASCLLFAREIEGNRGFGRMRTYANFQNIFKIDLEDELQIITEFTNCAGDVATISWVSNDGLICGTTTHSDSHNQQYNKQGNFLLCSMPQGTLRAFGDHRIPRPLVEKGENSTEAMRQSQDPWLYTSVVASNYDFERGLGYTASFDQTVKVWQIQEDGAEMQCIATWPHQGNVNFVAAAKDGSGRVASAADVPVDAIRVYLVNADDVSGSPYRSFSGIRNESDVDSWAYYPSTMQWGKAPGVQYLLLVGYSPRSCIGGDDADIPEDKRNTGTIILYDSIQHRFIPVSTARSANVFEVTWHPTLPRFIAATSPCGLSTEPGVRTQVHIFERDTNSMDEKYCVFQTLDCRASDINELTFMPNSLLQAYVTAACTDGKVYVWDTAQGDRSIHVLQHGPSLEIFDEEHREKLDTGVKFTAWGTTPDRFYTGGSDGAVNVWNIRNLTKPHVKLLLEAPAPIASGAFSPDMKKLAIGDATGRLWVYSTDDRDAPEAHFMTLPGSKLRRRCPRPFLPHEDPASPPMNSVNMDIDGPTNSGESDISRYASMHYLQSDVLVNTRNPVIGVVQGQNYTTSNLFRREAHLDENPFAPLLTDYDRQQRASVLSARGSRRRSLPRLRLIEKPSSSLQTVHEENRRLDKEIELWQEEIRRLPGEDITELNNLGAILCLEDI